MATTTALPRNRALARDIRLLLRLGYEIDWDTAGRWIFLRHFILRSGKFRYNQPSTYLVIMAPEDYGERRGLGSGLEEFYIHRDLRISRFGRWEELPHTFLQLDRQNGAASALEHRYCCVHIDWDPRRDTVLTALKALALYFEDPWAFERLGHHGR